MAVENPDRAGVVRARFAWRSAAVWEITVLALLSVLFALWGVRFIAATSFKTLDGRRSYSLSDDAMISMRYAWNLSHGNGLVWNQGERVQGYTNLLMVLIMSAATALLSKTNAVLAIQIMGAAFVLLIAWISREIGNHVFQRMSPDLRRAAGAIVFAGALSYYPLVYWSLMGMETGLLTVFLLAGLAELFRYKQSGEMRSLFLSAGSFSLMFLTRNDSVLFFFLAWACLAWEALQPDSKVRLRYVLAAGGIVLGVALAEFAFQYLYYGELLPNTFTLKLVGMPLSLRIRNGIGFVLPFFRESVIILALGLAGVVRRYRREKLLLFSILAIAILYQIYIGGDVWDYWRIMAPAIPLALILGADFLMGVAIDLADRRFAKPGVPDAGFLRANLSAVLLASLGLAAGLLWANARFLPEIAFQTPPYQVEDNRDNVNAAVALNHILGTGATVGVTWAGALPYYTDFKAIDFLGKEDRYIAHLRPDLSGSIHWSGMFSVPGHNKYDLQYSIETLKPTYVERLAWGRQDVSAWARDYYVEVEYKKHTFLLLKNSSQVLWDKLHLTPSGANQAP